MKTTLISERVWKQEQSWYLEKHFRVPGHTFRLEIRHNAYPFQSHGVINRWDGTAWQKVYAIPGVALRRGPSYVQNTATASDFSALDIEELETRALKIVNKR